MKLEKERTLVDPTSHIHHFSTMPNFIQASLDDLYLLLGIGKGRRVTNRSSLGYTNILFAWPIWGAHPASSDKRNKEVVKHPSCKVEAASLPVRVDYY